jgi:hypothetical protein
MTLPAPHKRSTAAERRANREAFKALKQAGLESRRAENRHSDYRHTVREKLQRIAKGERSLTPFSARQLSVLQPSEFAMVDGYARRRLANLTPEQRANVVKCLCLLLVLPTPDDWAAFVEYANGQAGPSPQTDTGREG